MTNPKMMLETGSEREQQLKTAERLDRGGVNCSSNRLCSAGLLDDGRSDCSSPFCDLPWTANLFLQQKTLPEIRQ
ncbi:hypothetical protein OJAV_G00160080 [Oryzias javanicus]|uniref:Uncharacterized protein n=1 Tax=Oryzias javanicus TaxID=123683 RepID=A0A437CJJ2_ORYJA|nr:hypothetical protein OJAV_G00160080 [Oryzias javanicus]